MGIYTGQRWVNKKRGTTIEVTGGDNRRPGRWTVRLHSVGLTVSLSTDELVAHYWPAN